MSRSFATVYMFFVIPRPRLVSRAFWWYSYSSLSIGWKGAFGLAVAGVWAVSEGGR